MHVVLKHKKVYDGCIDKKKKKSYMSQASY